MCPIDITERSLTLLPLEALSSIILPVLTFLELSTSQNTVAPCQRFDVPMLHLFTKS